MFTSNRHRFAPLLVLLVCSVIAGCGGGGGTGSSTTYPIGGMANGVLGSGLVLLDDGSDNLVIAPKADHSAVSFTFRTQVAVTGAYRVTVGAQPSTPAQTCTVVHDSGAANGPVTDVLVNCTGGGTANAWTFASGNDAVDTKGTYGTQNTSSSSTVPGARRAGASSWRDAQGNLWLFGGYGYDKNSTRVYLNDLWKYRGGQWTWVSGSDDSATQHAGIYGSLGVAAATNVPGAREQAASWVDGSGNLWLFGGYGYASGAALGYLNDVWEYDIGAAKWIWRAGANTTDQAGVYVTLGTLTPGARAKAMVWSAGGTVWLFGGHDQSPTSPSELNDLWSFNGSQWTLVKGTATPNGNSVTGTVSTPAANNVPGARESSATWVDASSNLWLFGGQGYNSTAFGYLNDLWKYDRGVGQWALMRAESPVNQTGTYSKTAAPANIPGARDSASAWLDASGTAWLFGGYGYDKAAGPGFLNDVWKYAGGEWTWVNGSDMANQFGGGVPGARRTTANWIDTRTGLLWIFGGEGYTSAGATGFLNDLWYYTP